MYPQIKNTVIHLRINNHQAFYHICFIFLFLSPSFHPPAVPSFPLSCFVPPSFPSFLLTFFLYSFSLYFAFGFFKYKFIYFNWRLITLQYCSGFAIRLYAILPLHTKSASQKIRIIYYKATVSIKFSRLIAMN